MGAIAGLFHPATPKPVDVARVRAMAAAMAYRGPDGAGEWTAPGVGFAHRRLAIVDAGGSPQPVATPDLRYALVLDGTILNHAALRDELRAAGRVFHGDGDAEVVLEGFAAWGPALLHRLEGAFAFAVHDAATQTLFLARDRLGAKPLHYVTLADGALAFASELTGLLAHPLFRRSLDARAVDDFLALGHVPDDACVLAGVAKLPAGHFLLMERGRTPRPPRRYWQVTFGGVADEAGLLDNVRAVVRAAATGDAMPGGLLSGSTGDAAVVALMAEASARGVATATVAASDAAAVRAGEVARRFATAHRSLAIGADGAIAALPDVIAAFDEPFAHPEALYAVAAATLARTDGRSVLAGTGADLLFGGAARHGGFAWRQRWRETTWMPAAVARLLGDARTDHARAVGVAATTVYNTAGRHAVDGHRPHDRYASAWRDAAGGDPFDRAQHAGLTIDAPARVLAIADRAGMAAGVEWRAPLLDQRLVTFVTALPRGVRGRRDPLGDALRRYLPPASPMPAEPSPIAAWLRGPLGGPVGANVAALGRSRLLGDLGWFDLDRIARSVEAHRAGRADHDVMLWRLLILEQSLSRLFAL